MRKPVRTACLVTALGHRTARAVLSLTLAATTIGCAMQTPSASGAQAASTREDIYVLRSQREERTPNSTWCTSERAGFAPFDAQFRDDRFTMWSTQVMPVDGRMVSASANSVGELRACYGATEDPRRINFYAEGRIGSISYTGSGDCLTVRSDFPEKGISTVRCYLNLRGLPSSYVGGFLATNTVVSKAVLGGETDPPGYTQASIATIRLWRAR